MEILLNNNISAGTYKFALISHDEKTTTTIRDGAKNIAKKKIGDKHFENMHDDTNAARRDTIFLRREKIEIFMVLFLFIFVQLSLSQCELPPSTIGIIATLKIAFGNFFSSFRFSHHMFVSFCNAQALIIISMIDPFIHENEVNVDRGSDRTNPIYPQYVYPNNRK